jgi:hypothetical protein
VSQEEDFSTLPTTYYAPGSSGHLYMRSDWSEKATVIGLQLGQLVEGHGHVDAGTFQMMRGTRWLSKESTGYSRSFKGASCGETGAHNGIRFNGRGIPSRTFRAADGLRGLEACPEYTNVVVDLTKAYLQWRGTPKHENVHVNRCIRQFLFLRPNILVLFDRAETASPEVHQQVLIHFPEKPEIRDGNLVIGINGDQQLACLTLWPARHGYEIVDEGDTPDRRPSSSPGWFQWRLEVTQSGATEQYSLNVLVADTKDTALPAATAGQEDDRIVLRIRTPGREWEVRFARSLTDFTGRIKLAEGGRVTADRVFYDKVQGIKVDADGVHWEPQGPATGKP